MCKNVFFLPTGDPHRQAHTIDAKLATPQHVLASAFEGMFRWDPAVAAGKCEVQTLYIASTRPHGDVAQFQGHCLHPVHGQVAGSGHFVQLVVLEHVNAMNERFPAIHLRSPANIAATSLTPAGNDAGSGMA